MSKEDICLFLLCSTLCFSKNGRNTAADRRWLLHRPGRRSTEESTSFRQKRVALVVLTATTDLAAEARRRRRSRGASTLLRLHPHPLRFHLSTSSLLFLSAYLMMWWRVWSIHDRALSSSGLNTPFFVLLCVPFFVFPFASSLLLFCS